MTKDKKGLLFLGMGVLFSLIVAYMLFHIIYWFIYNNYNNDTVQFIKDTEVVGVEVNDVYDTLNQTVKAKEYPFIDVDFQRLKERNADTVAWLKVDAIGLDIPIVQTIDNDYYLTHDIDKNNNPLGWVFADTRSNTEFLGTNTVLYGHNAASKKMFGSLKGLLELNDPEKKEQAQIIQFSTPTKQMVFEISSIYVTHYEDWRYVEQLFGSQEEKQLFVDRMKELNSVDMFDRDDLSPSDNYLTFSTCYGPAGTEDRLVVHAKLVAERDAE